MDLAKTMATPGAVGAEWKMGLGLPGMVSFELGLGGRIVLLWFESVQHTS